MAHASQAQTLAFFSKVSEPSKRDCVEGSWKRLEISQSRYPHEELTYTVDWKVVQSTFDDLIASHDGELPEDLTLNSILNSADETAGPDGVLDQIRRYNRRLGTDLASASQGHAFVNGKHFVLDDVSEM